MTRIPTDHELDEMESHLDGISPGPWRLSMTGYSVKSEDNTIVSSVPRVTVPSDLDFPRWISDGEFIANARTDLPVLLAAIRDLKAEVRYLRLTLGESEELP